MEQNIKKVNQENKRQTQQNWYPSLFVLPKYIRSLHWVSFTVAQVVTTNTLQKLYSLPGISSTSWCAELQSPISVHIISFSFVTVQFPLQPYLQQSTCMFQISSVMHFIISLLLQRSWQSPIFSRMQTLCAFFANLARSLCWFQISWRWGVHRGVHSTCQALQVSTSGCNPVGRQVECLVPCTLKDAHLSLSLTDSLCPETALSTSNPSLSQHQI